MKVIEYFSNIAMPLMIIIIVLYGVIERKKVFDIFLEGAKEGIGVVFSIFPTLVGLFVAIGALRSSGIIDMIINRGITCTETAKRFGVTRSAISRIYCKFIKYIKKYFNE